MSLHLEKKIIKRDTLLFILIVLAIIAVLIRAFDVQILEASFLQSEGNKRQIRSMTISAPRGEIFDRNGVVLALSTPIASVWCDPKELIPYLKLNQSLQTGSVDFLKEHSEKELIRAKHLLAQYRKMIALLNLSRSSVTLKILSKPNRQFMYLKRFILPDLATKISALNLPGVYIQSAYKRYYPAGETTSHLLGFTDIDGKGIAGIEDTYNKWLHGEPGKKIVIKDRAGHIVDFVKDLTVAKPGKPIYLSIDSDLQFFLERALKRVMIEQEPVSASSVILDAKTGEVLALVDLPSFNPNDRSQLQGAAIRNSALVNVFEPGSTIKPLVMAKALSLKVVHIGEKINTNPGAIWIQGRRITDTKNKGVLTLEGVIQHSSNVGMSIIALKMKAKSLWELYHGVGFGEALGTFLPGESSGYVKPYEAWQKVEQASMAFGYGLNVNLLQLARAYTIFTNQGRLLPVTFIKKQSKTQAIQQNAQSEQVVTEQSAKQVVKMMEKVLSFKGTAPKAMIHGYQVAGKTGTTHISDNGGYESNQYHGMFVGIVPATHPKFIMATIINQPSRGIYYGGAVAAPVFKEVMTQALRLYNIPSDEVRNMPVNQPKVIKAHENP
jgi:cell division protein FtsI (penicillin-binding protein 3)